MKGHAWIRVEVTLNGFYLGGISDNGFSRILALKSLQRFMC